MAWMFWHEIGRKLIHITILIVLALYFLIEDRYGKQVAHHLPHPRVFPP